MSRCGAGVREEAQSGRTKVVAFHKGRIFTTTRLLAFRPPFSVSFLSPWGMLKSTPAFSSRASPFSGHVDNSRDTRPPSSVFVFPRSRYISRSAVKILTTLECARARTSINKVYKTRDSESAPCVVVIDRARIHTASSLSVHPAANAYPSTSIHRCRSVGPHDKSHIATRDTFSLPPTLPPSLSLSLACPEKSNRIAWCR